MLTDRLRLKKARKLLNKINKLGPKMQAMTDEELQGQTAIFKNQLKEGRSLDDILPEVYATVREADRRILGMFPYDVQVLGAIILHNGSIAEMKTGEGKTLVDRKSTRLNSSHQD